VFLDNYSKFAFATLTGEIDIWDLVLRKRIRTLEGHRTKVNSMIELPGQRLASCDMNEVKVWKVKSGTCVLKYDASRNDETFNCLGFNKCIANKLFIGGDRGITVWDLTTAVQKRLRLNHLNNVEMDSYVMLFSKGCAFFALGSDILVKRYSSDFKLYKSERVLRGHGDNVLQLELSESNLISGSQDQTIKVWDLITFHNIHTLTDHSDSILSLLLYGPGILASSSNDGFVLFWDMKTWKCKGILKAHDGHGIGMIGFLKDGTFLSCGADGTIKFWTNIQIV